MNNLSLINNNVSNILREDNNEVVYRAWLSFTENANLEDGNIIITVPNQYIKETIEDRYFSTIEELYRNELQFSILIIKTEAEQIVDTFRKAESIDLIEDDSLDAVEKIMLASNQFTVSL
jgi:chromosomal replication initiation ATPase DnaA